MNKPAYMRERDNLGIASQRTPKMLHLCKVKLAHVELGTWGMKKTDI